MAEPMLRRNDLPTARFTDEEILPWTAAVQVLKLKRTATKLAHPIPAMPLSLRI
jgi:hypothetical protein